MINPPYVVLRLDSRSQLGEGISWHSADSAWPKDGFFFVDIHGKRLHFTDENGENHQEWTTPERIGWIISSQLGGHLLAGLQTGIARISLDDEFRILSWPARLLAEQPDMRLNDAKADPKGNLWAGSLNNNDEQISDGKLFRISSNGDAIAVDSDYRVPNGPAISPNGLTMLHTDSALRTIYAFDLDINGGTLLNKRIWLKLSATEGFPDGMTIDCEGCVWVAHWGAGCVSRYTPDAQLVARFHLPVSLVTNVAFGGARMNRLWVTTAHATLPPSKLATEPLAGGVFEIIGHGTCGLPPNKANI